jgi:pimeloyl-ACP methyl ester carboxylesterase
MLRIAWVLLIGYLVVVAMLAWLQRSLIYFPLREATVDPYQAGYVPGQVEAVSLRTDDGLTLSGWLVLADGERASTADEWAGQLRSGRNVVLYFPGNAANRAYRVAEAAVLTNAGAHVLLFDYRGYGDNAGRPTEENLASDAQAVWKYATSARYVAPDRIVLYGESLGGAVAVRLAAELSRSGTPPAGLILRSTFPSLAEAGAHHYPWLPVRWILVDRYPAVDQVREVASPVLQIHGTDDTIVPIRLARRLAAATPEKSAEGFAKRFVELRGAGHNDVLYAAEDEVRHAVREFLRTLNRGTRTSP